METPAFTRIADAVVDDLAAAGIAGGRVSHIYPSDAALAHEAVAVGVESSQPDAGTVASGFIDWTTTLRVDCYVRFGVNARRPHEAVTALYGAVFARLLANPTLDGLCMDIEPGTAGWNYADDERQLALVSSVFRIRHRTSNNSTAS